MMQQIEAELARYPEVGWALDRQVRSRHPRIVIRYRDRSRFLVLSKTKIERRAMRNKISDLRRVLIELGVTHA